MCENITVKIKWLGTRNIPSTIFRPINEYGNNTHTHTQKRGKSESETTSEILSAPFHIENIATLTRKATIHTTNSKEITHTHIVEERPNSDLTPSELPPYIALLISKCFTLSSAVVNAHNA